jgi:hypothetical protein
MKEWQVWNEKNIRKELYERFRSFFAQMQEFLKDRQYKTARLFKETEYEYMKYYHTSSEEKTIVQPVPVQYTRTLQRAYQHVSRPKYNWPRGK